MFHFHKHCANLIGVELHFYKKSNENYLNLILVLLPRHHIELDGRVLRLKL